MIECVPNISEGRRLEVVDRIVAPLSDVRGVHLLDLHSDPDHNRSVVTIAGQAGPLRDAVLALFEGAVAHLDLRTHQGEHPRIGAVDVTPFVPLAGATMGECVELAREVAADVARRYGIPIFLYEAAATDPSRTRLEAIRRGGFEGLPAKLGLPEWVPDFGPSHPHPTAGASVVGARRLLIAFNINLRTDRLDIARRIAATVRASSGGLPHVKAIGVRLHRRGIVQVSMNLTDYEQTPLPRVFEAVTREAARHGIQILGSEIVGLVPAGALDAAAGYNLQLEAFSPDQVLETRLHRTHS